MIHPRRALPLPLVLALLAMGCALAPRPPDVPSTPAAPRLHADEVAQTLRLLASAGRPAPGDTAGTAARTLRLSAFLAERLRRNGVQPLAPRYTLSYPGKGGGVSVLAGVVAGRDPFVADSAVLVVAPPAALAGGEAALAAWLELGHLYADLGRYYRYPAPAVVLLMPLAADVQTALAAYATRPAWPLSHTRAVVVLGAAAPPRHVWTGMGVPATAPVESLAVPPAPPPEGGEAPALQLVRQAYAWLLPYTAAAPPL